MILRNLSAPALSCGVGETGLVIRCDTEHSVAIQNCKESQLESNVLSTYTAHITVLSMKRKSGVSIHRFYSGQLHFSPSEKLQQMPRYKDDHHLEIIARHQHHRYSHVGAMLTHFV